MFGSIFLLFNCISTLFIPSALATTFYTQPFPDSVREAPQIVRGVIGASHTDWNPDAFGNRRIYTLYEMQPTEILKGNLPSGIIVIRELGGEKDGIGLQVPGVAQFERGEDTLVFLKEKNSNNTYDVHGMMMGKYSIHRESEGTEWLSGPGLTEINSTGMPTQKKWTLSDLRQLIRSQSETENQTENLPSPSKQAHSASPATSGETHRSTTTAEPHSSRSPLASPQEFSPPISPSPSSVQSWVPSLALFVLISLAGLFVFTRRKR